MTTQFAGPTAKEQRYDRQLRLWGANGQAKLESSHVLLVNSGPGIVGVEVLKNLILPGCGAFTIIDDAEVTKDDLQRNFFISKEYLGQSRAKACTELLGELNPEVKGHYKTDTKSLATDSLSEYTLVLLSFDVAPELSSKIAEHASSRQVPVISIHTVGFYAYFRVSLPSVFPVTDTHPDASKFEDLRLLSPWPELVSFAKSKSQDMEQMDEADHGHIPYVVLLLHYLDEWKAKHGSLPTAYKDKKEFQSFVLSSQRTDNAEGGEENYEEAASVIIKSLNPFSLPGSLREIFAMSETVSPQVPFFALAGAVKQFYEKHNILPLSGGLPDMKARSDDYVALAKIYRQKAQADVDEVTSYLPASMSIPRQAVEEFCRHAAFVRVLHGGAGHDVQKAVSLHSEALNTDLAYNPATLIPLWATFEAYRADSSKPPFEASKEIISKISPTTPEATFSAQELDLPTYLAKISEEFVRAGGVELHVTAGIIGGMVAQEAVKILTGQYVPANNVVVWDGIESKVAVYDLTVPATKEDTVDDGVETQGEEMEIETGDGRKRKRLED